MDENYLAEKFSEWVKLHGRLPKRDELKTCEGYPSSYQYFKILKLTKWNEVLSYFGYIPKVKRWTNDEVSYLKKNWNVLLDVDLAKKLNRSVTSIEYMRNELGLLRQSKKQPWEQWEKEFLKENFYEAVQSDIEKILSHRKWETIRSYATKMLKLKRKNPNYKYQSTNGKRICKDCKKEYPESSSYFYKDGDIGFRTRCITCYNAEQEKLARNKGIYTRKLKKEKFEEGYARCSSCKCFKSISLFNNYDKGMKLIRRYCIDCERNYMHTYHLKSIYGENYREVYIEKNQRLFDIRGQKWDSEIEKDITNWLIINKFTYQSGPNYKVVFENDTSKRRFDWELNLENKIYHVEYFGLWDINSKNNIIIKYVNKAKKKINKLYRNRENFNFIIIFPCDIKNKKFSEIFSRKTF
ncbi:hypothetical protein MKZ20_08120 [Psychrobacillus sp. FSL K6-2684]|uniref:hypothetical protein n=1 Tax=Psychrobacillus sp. FSL K6-2684 TaxID=2921547 RepID=UPI0030FB2AC4